MEKKVKTLFLSKNYLVIDSAVDCSLVFAPMGDGSEGGDIIYLRGGRWSFRINDFLAGELLPDGSREQIGAEGKGYNVNLSWIDNSDETGIEVKEPVIYTTYRNPANVQALDGQAVSIVGTLNFDKKGLATDASIENLKNNLFKSTEAYAIKDFLIKKIGDSTNDLSALMSGIKDSVGLMLDIMALRQRALVRRTFIEGAYPAGALFYFNNGSIIKTSDVVNVVYLGGSGSDTDCLIIGRCYRFDGSDVSEIKGSRFKASECTKVLV